MNTQVWTYLAYLSISIAITVWVARTLSRNGRIFLVDAFHGNEKVADSINHLLVVGFYLVNIGFVSLALQFGGKTVTVQDAIEYLSLKIGLVLVILGVMHFGNLVLFSRLRRRGLRPTPVLEALPADTAVNPNYINRLREAKDHSY
jgi:hypothetical protein